MSDIQEQLERLRRDVDQLLARLPTVETTPAYGSGSTGQVNEALVRHLKESLQREGKTRGVAICRIVVTTDEGGTMVRSGIITSSSADDFEKPPKLRQSVAALATDPLAIRAVRKLVQLFFDGKPMQMTKAELAAALGVSEADVENSLRPLVADSMLRWSKTATGEEAYEIQEEEPHILLIQSLE